MPHFFEPSAFDEYASPRRIIPYIRLGEVSDDSEFSVGPRATDSLPVGDAISGPSLADSEDGLSFFRGFLNAVFVSVAAWVLIGISLWMAFS
jgi:hypothetical protein